MAADIPSDETGDAIRQWAAEGSDLTKPMKVDFFVSVPTEAVGLAFAKDPELGIFSELSVEQDSETGRWTCYCSKVLIPTYLNVVQIEQLLATVANRYGADLDGFGSFGNAHN